MCIYIYIYIYIGMSFAEPVTGSCGRRGDAVLMRRGLPKFFDLDVALCERGAVPGGPEGLEGGRGFLSKLIYIYIYDYVHTYISYLRISLSLSMYMYMYVYMYIYIYI